MSTDLSGKLDQVVKALSDGLGANLHCCCLYGSAVRGNAIAGVSDINLLIILNESTPAAQDAIARAIAGNELIDPFVLGRHGFDRSVRAFATKFASIKRNYRVLAGVDPLISLTLDQELEKFLCEQSLRNLRLRLVHTFITRAQHKSYDKFLLRNITGIFVQISEALRLNNVVVPPSMEARVPVLAREYQVEAQILSDLLALKKDPHRFSEEDVVQWHGRVFPLLNAVLGWIETKWPANP